MTPRGENLNNPHSRVPAGISGHLDNWQEAAVDYLDGRLTPEEKAAVEEHLAHCALCAERMAAQQEIVIFVQHSPWQDPPTDLEDRILGELLFPLHANAPASQLAPGGRASATTSKPRGFARLRPWLPLATVLIVVLAGIVVAGVLRQNSNVAPTTARLAVTTVTAAGQTEMATSPGLGDKQGVTTTAKATVTTAGAAATTTPTVVASADKATGGAQVFAAYVSEAIRDKKAMVETLEDAAGPGYLAFITTDTSSGAADDGGATASPDSSATETTTDTTALASTPASSPPATELSAQKAELASELTAFTELQPLSADLSLGGPTFAGYVTRKHLSSFLDVLFSIKASTQSDLALTLEPQPEYAANAERIVEHKAELPVIVRQVVPQPAVYRYAFTTSTLVSNRAEVASSAATPDDEGTHILLVIYVR